MQKPIIVLASDAALAGLVSRSLRLQHIYAVPMPVSTSAPDVLAASPSGIIWATPQDGLQDVPLPADELQASGVPLLVLGDAATALCLSLGGTPASVLPGPQTITFGLADTPLFSGISGGERVLHDLTTLTLPDSLLPLVTATEQSIGFSLRDFPVYALEYPIEHNDPDGGQLLYNFATQVCDILADWDEEAIIRQAQTQIRHAAGEGGVLCAVSGGLDSAVCAKLAHMAVGDRLRCVFIDTGLLREGEAEEVLSGFQGGMGLTIHTIDARERFLSAVSQVHTPEEKERITISLLHQVLCQELTEHPELQTLITGTNYNDWLYAAPKEDRLDASYPCRVIEPLRHLFKEEIRRVGVSLSLPASILDRQSFPSSGLALRIVGEVSPERLALLRKADAFFLEEIRAGGHDKRLWQYYATLLDSPLLPGTYAVILRALQAMQGGAFAARLPYDLLERVTQRIQSEVPEVSRVTYDLTPSAQYREQE